MPDDPDDDPLNPAQAAQDPESRAEVNIDDPQSTASWAVALGVTVEALQSAVLAVGRRVDRIKDYLAGGMAKNQQDG